MPVHIFIIRYTYIIQSANHLRYILLNILQYYPSQVFGAIHGEDIPYILGMPLSGGSFHLRLNYSNHEKVLSEAMMNYLQNFAQFGYVSVYMSIFYK